MCRPSTSFGGRFIAAGYEEVVLPAIWEQQTFSAKIGPEKAEQMWNFTDKGDRSVCLIPEATGIIQEMWNGGWDRSMKKPARLFYAQRCYRYDRPQKGRYREFTQFGIELLGNTPGDREEAVSLLRTCLDDLGVPYTFVDGVKRGLGYYVEDGFEAESESLGAQKQIAGGGRYREGIGWAIGVDRVMLLK